MQWYILYTYSTFMNITLLANPPLLPSLARFLPPCVWTTPFTYMEIPFLVIVVRMSIHARPRLVIHCPPLLPTLPLPSQQHPQFVLHVYRDDITASVTLSDTSHLIALGLILPLKIIYNLKIIFLILQYQGHHWILTWRCQGHHLWNLSTKLLRYQTYLIPNPSDTQLYGYWTFQIQNLSDTKISRDTLLVRCELIYQAA